MKRVLLLFVFAFSMTATFAQTIDELKAEQATKKDSIAAIKGRVDALQGQIDAFPGWKKGAFGTIGANLSNFNNWYSKGAPNSSAGNIGITVNAFANLDREKFFWKNAVTVNLAWVKLDDKNNPDDSKSFESASDIFDITSLYGYKLSEQFAISALGEYRTSIINNFNDPGYLDLGVGGTWTPIKNLVVVIHPLDYNFVFAKSGSIFESSLGAKIVADYTRQIGKVSFKTNFTTFQSYKKSDYSIWTWTNSFGYTLWKMIGVGFDFGLRDSKAEALNYALNTPVPLGDPNARFDTIDNKLQTYWLVGLNYSF